MMFASIVSADVPPEQKHEVEHLINFVKTSSCEINRNDQYHDGEKALAHIQLKYDYFRNKIKTTEQFIEYSATKSTMSGKFYLVRCGDQPPQKTKDWLLHELERYRKNVKS